MHAFTAGIVILTSLFTSPTQATSPLDQHVAGLTRATAPSCSYVPSNPPPQGLVCGKTGALRRPAIVSTKNTDKTSCVNSCLGASRDGCVSFSYGPGNKCTLYSKPIYGTAGTGQWFVPSSTSKQTFWNRRCWQQSCTCPKASTKCLGSCVDTSSDPNNCGGCGQSIGNSGNNTCCSGKGTNTLTDVNNCGSCGKKVTDTGDDTCCAGTPKNTQTDPANCGGCGLGISSTDDKCCAGTGVDSQSDANNCGACGTVCDAGKGCFSATCCTRTAVATELLQNGDFENGGSNWDMSPGGYTNPTWYLAEHGDTSAAIHCNYNMPSGYIKQDVNVAPGQIYTVSGYYDLFQSYPHGTDTTVDQFCTFIISLGNKKLIERHVTPADLGNWTPFIFDRVEYDSVASDGATTATFSMTYSCPQGYLGGQGDDSIYSTVHLDNFSIQYDTLQC